MAKSEKLLRSRAERIVLGIACPILILWSLTLIYPVFWMFINSFRESAEVASAPLGMPTEWHFENWISAFTETTVRYQNYDGRANLLEMFLNSVWWTAGSVVISNFVVVMTAYAVAKYSKYFICKALFALNLVVMAIPIVGALPSQLQLYTSLGIRNNPAMLLTTAGAIGGSALMIYYSFFKNISWSYAEAVLIDGGGHWTVFFKVMVPQATPIIIAMCVISCIGAWGDYMTPYLFLQDNPTIASGLHLAKLNHGNEAVPSYLAAVIMSTIPMFILFICFQKQIMTNVSMGGLKG